MVAIQLSVHEPSDHLVAVEMRLPPRQAQLRLRLPAWTPGSYLIRDYVRNLEGLEVLQGERPLPLRRLEPGCCRQPGAGHRR